MTTPNKTAEAVERQDLEALIAELEARANARHSGEASPTARLCARAAQALTHAQQSDARVREALETLIRHFEGDELHDEGAFDATCADCLALDEARQALASLTAPKPPCEICGGRGEVGGWSGQTAESGGWETMPCECVQQAPKPEEGETANFGPGARAGWNMADITEDASPAPSRVEPVAITNALEMTGLKTEAELIDMANVGQSLLERIADLVEQDGPFKGWMPADDPAEIVFDLVDHYEEAAPTTPPDAQDRVAALEKALEPFAEAARLGAVSGRPPFEFVCASDYEAARAALKAEEKG